VGTQADGTVPAIERAVPRITAMRTYHRAWLPKDIAAGLVLTALLVPQGMAYAELAGLPAITGLYTSILCLLGYALFGPSRILVLGPDSSLGPMIAATIVPLVAADGDPVKAVALASMLALLVGACMIAAGLGRLGFVADLFSKPTQLGYMNGLALTILVGQLPKLFGFSIDADTFLEDLTGFVRGVADGRTVGAAAALMWALADVDVSGRDVDGLALTLAPAVTVGGRIAFAGAAPAPTPRIALRLIAAHPTSVSTNVTLSPGADGTFAIQNVIPGTYRIDATSPGWSLQSTSIAGRDVTDGLFEVKPGESVANAVVTLTNAPASLSGTLFDAANRPSSDLAIVLFSADPTHWFAGSRRLRQPVRPDSNGKFSFATLPAGDYYLAALTDYEPTDWFNPSFLEQVAPGAIKVTIGAGERKVQDVRIK
jgi:hypothetical protein